MAYVDIFLHDLDKNMEDGKLLKRLAQFGKKMGPVAL